MISFPVWRNEDLTFSGDVLRYYITFNGETVYNGRAYRRPGATDVKIFVDSIIGDYLENEIDIEAMGVTQQEDAYGVFDVYSQEGTHLAQYGVLFNFADEWSGETMVLAEPVNGHLDPRMNMYWSKYNTGQTTEVVVTEDIYFFNVPASVSVLWNAGEAVIPVNTNYPYGEIQAVCPEGVVETGYGPFYAFDVPINETQSAVTYTVQWYRKGELLAETVITVGAYELEFICDATAVAPPEGGNFYIHYVSNIPDNKITVNLPYGWTLVSLVDGVATISVPPNNTGSALSKTVSFYFNGELLGTTTVSQSVSTATDWFYATPTIRMSYAGGTMPILIDTSYDISTITITASSGATVTNVSQTGCYVSAPENLRNSPVYYTITYTRNGVQLGTTNVTVAGVGEYYSEYFTVEVTKLSNGEYAFTLSNWNGVSNMQVEVSKNNGPWQALTIKPYSEDLYPEYSFVIFSGNTVGDTYRFRSNGGMPLKKTWSGSTQPVGTDDYTFSFATGYPNGDEFKIYGNILSLVYGDNFENQTTFPAGQFWAFFAMTGSQVYPYGLMDASDLILPVANVPDCGYRYMFAGQRYLKRAPQIPATTIGERGCSGMFKGCSSLSEAPVVNADQIGVRAYESMFAECSGLTKVQETLPATVLAKSCYESMYLNCKNIKYAPDLIAPVIEDDAYMQMFSGCENLERVKCLATSHNPQSDTDYAFYMLYGVASGGVFIKPASATFWSHTNVRGIPADWTIQNI